MKRTPLTSLATSLLAAFTLVVTPHLTRAGSATWQIAPASGDWNTPANWTPATVPNGPADTATFGASNITAISNSASTEVNGIVFNSGASSYQITTNSQTAPFRISGTGITNNSGATQNFIVSASSTDYGTLTFLGSAAAGTLTNYTVAGGQVASGGFPSIVFGNTATAGSATFTVNPGVVAGANGGLLDFSNNSTAGTATVTLNGGSVSGALGGEVVFSDTATADAATLIANEGTRGGSPGVISFTGGSSGGTAAVVLNRTGTLDISQHNAPGVTIGSLDGNGAVTLGGVNLTIGTSNFTTTFSGTISDDGTGGSLSKVGKGRLTLSKANTYTGPTTNSKCTLLVSKKNGSATGTGAVLLKGGTLGGTGIIAGPVTVAGSLTGILAPGGGSKPGTLTILSSVTFSSRATYRVDVNSNLFTWDQTIANGVTITTGSAISINDLGSGTITPGAVLTVINNTSTSPISGTFVDLSDGGTLTVGNNTYQADYQGGDGNDLTLTVVP